MQKTLLEIEQPNVSGQLDDARQRLVGSLRSLDLPAEDYTYLDNLLNIYSERPNLGADAFARQIVSYVRSCLLQIHLPGRESKTNSNLKQLDRRLDPVKKAAFVFRTSFVVTLKQMEMMRLLKQ